MFSIFSRKKKPNDQWLPDTKFFIHDEVELKKSEAPSHIVNENADLGGFEGFDKYLEGKLNVSVQWTDREIFFIQSPNSDTVQNLKNILENYWDQK